MANMVWRRKTLVGRYLQRGGARGEARPVVIRRRIINTGVPELISVMRSPIRGMNLIGYDAMWPSVIMRI